MSTCKIEDCVKPVLVRGWCSTHYSRWKRLGDANATVAGWTRQAKTCTVPGCDKRPNARGLCKSHYNRWLQTGSTKMAPERVRKPCTINGCDTPSKGRDLCSKHYERWRRYGDPLHVTKPLRIPEPRAKPQPPGPCTVDGCDRKRHARGYCSKHYSRWVKHGDPLTVAERKPKVERETVPQVALVDPPEHLVAFLRKREARIASDLRRSKVASGTSSHPTPTRPSVANSKSLERVKR